MTRSALLQRAHLAIGLLGVVVFVGTGLYMDRSLAHLEGMPDAPRVLYRSGHIYILLSALVHLILGAYVTPRESAAGRALQLLASLLLLAATTLFIYGFIVETPLGLVERPMTRVAIELSLGGVLLHTMVAVLFRQSVVGAS
jgi:hypothetical protein